MLGQRDGGKRGRADLDALEKVERDSGDVGDGCLNDIRVADDGDVLIGMAPAHAFYFVNDSSLSFEHQFPSRGWCEASQGIEPAPFGQRIELAPRLAGPLAEIELIEGLAGTDAEVASLCERLGGFDRPLQGAAVDCLQPQLCQRLRQLRCLPPSAGV